MTNRTPSQTVGPFFHEALRWKDAACVTFAEPGERVVVAGRLLDGAGEPVADALVETWQRAPTGRTPAPATGAANPHGFGRTQSGADGAFRIETLMPGGETPHLEVAILARGLLKALRTRVYLATEAQARADPDLAPIAGSQRIATLIASAEGGGQFRWDVRLQGDGETVFFAA